MENVIETMDLSKYYGDIKALKPINLKVPKNSIFGFLGPNGAGKTTLMKTIVGLVRPTSGSCNIFGEDILKGSINIRSRIGYLPQDINFYGHMTVKELLEFSFRFFVIGPKDLMDIRIEEIIDKVGLSNKQERVVEKLSGGETQRLGLAQAQIHYPDLLILDEPAASLDPIGRKDILDIMDELRKETTIFYSTHILDDVQKVSDTVAILNKGELISQGPIEELLKGSEGIIYTVKLKGDSKECYERIKELPWIQAISSDTINETTTWQVSVSDEEIAEKKLQREILKDKNISIFSFNKKTYELEDIFMDLVGENNGN
ncbi:MAG: ABC transporter ATP-binding protein [Candidatus Hodarchaeales archaeon]|jgi:ABC-2 type transport system ATP-binding protein